MSSYIKLAHNKEKKNILQCCKPEFFIINLKGPFPSSINKQRLNVFLHWPLTVILTLNSGVHTVHYKDVCATVASSLTILTKFPEKVISILLEMKILLEKIHDLYTRNPMGLTHCAVKGLMNLYPMQWSPLINDFEFLFCLITWSHPLIMTAGSERGKQLPITKHAMSERCVHVHICNYVHIWEAVLPAQLAVCVNELLWK